MQQTRKERSVVFFFFTGLVLVNVWRHGGIIYWCGRLIGLLFLPPTGNSVFGAWFHRRFLRGVGTRTRTDRGEAHTMPRLGHRKRGGCGFRHQTGDVGGGRGDFRWLVFTRNLFRSHTHAVGGGGRGDVLSLGGISGAGTGRWTGGERVVALGSERVLGRRVSNGRGDVVGSWCRGEWFCFRRVGRLIKNTPRKEETTRDNTESLEERATRENDLGGPAYPSFHRKRRRPRNYFVVVGGILCRAGMLFLG